MVDFSGLADRLCSGMETELNEALAVQEVPLVLEVKLEKELRYHLFRSDFSKEFGTIRDETLPYERTDDRSIMGPKAILEAFPHAAINLNHYNEMFSEIFDIVTIFENYGDTVFFEGLSKLDATFCNFKQGSSRAYGKIRAPDKKYVKGDEIPAHWKHYQDIDRPFRVIR